MLSYVFMKILEGRPRSYERRIKVLRGRHVRAMRRDVVAAVPARSRVLDIGCGTGELAALLIAEGCAVDAFDLDPTMVATARERLGREHPEGRFSVNQMGIDAMDELPGGSYDAAVVTLVLSELTDDEIRFALSQAHRVLTPAGRLVIADEVLACSVGRRVLQMLLRLPLLAVTYLITRTSTRPVADLTGGISAAGFTVTEERRTQSDTFAVVIARRNAGPVA
jgi:demethylmenaquinone methyltransferase/2-methoxy-6-polyprenyl-1,4-benzoquinol methylase